MTATPKVALVYPPTCDPTAPYVSVPILTAWLRAHGVEVLPVDANVEAWDELLRRPRLEACARRLEDRLADLERRRTLDHAAGLLHAALWRARADARAAPGAIEEAVAVLRGPRFHDPAAYADAVATVESAQRLIGAAHAPLTIDFTAYRTPFSLLGQEAIARDAEPDRDPFHAYHAALAERLGAAGVGLVGLSVAFPGQVQPAYALALHLRARLPNLPVVAGGPAMTQLLTRLDGPAQARALGPLSAAVAFEGERPLLEIVRALAGGRAPRGVIVGGCDPLGALPAPDFSDLPLDRYLSPEPVLPYDATRGCYWGRCAFCHYGLAAEGTARYRERPIATVVAHLDALAARHRCRVFYLSHDSVAPRALAALARAHGGAPRRRWRWATDLRPERGLTAERCRELAAGGGLAVSLGVESAAPRVLELIDKGTSPATIGRVVDDLAAAGLAVEAMCFTDFPTETYAEARATLRFLEEHDASLALFIVGRFDLTPGARVARHPDDYGLAEIWTVEGDELKTGLFYAERRPPKTDDERARLEAELDRRARRVLLRRYPWAGALSTAHSLLHYERAGPGVFRALAGRPAGRVPGARPLALPSSFDVAGVAARAARAEAAIWHALVHERRRVSPAEYEALSAGLPRSRRRPGRWVIEPGEEPRPARRRG